MTVGASAGTGTFTNNGATINTEKTYGDFAASGAMDTAANSVDKYTYFSIGQTTTGRTITLPTPTTSPTSLFGRIIHVSNIGSTSFTISGSLIMPGYTATFVWSNTDGVATGGESWQYAGDGGGSGSYIQNQNALQQASSNFWLSGTGRADTSILTPTIDTATGVALNIGTSGSPTTTQININQSTVLASGKTILVLHRRYSYQHQCHWFTHRRHDDLRHNKQAAPNLR
ncbi:hypothetical protein IPL68_04505 [Candidatus Saccharibacteria bacterium]|nr:MAG: hypothetical protein IPL68_04505 [Candidatus Saccharibacteria bacterium]